MKWAGNRPAPNPGSSKDDLSTTPDQPYQPDQPASQTERTSAEPLLRRLDLTVRHRLDGLLQGNYLGLVPGPGTEAGESRPYVPGDDVRRMDWPVTARTMQPYVRQTIADRELETWLAVDLSPSVDFGTALSEKRDLVLAAITAVVHMTTRGGNRVGAIVTTGERTFRIPALPGVAHSRHLIKTIAQTPRAATAGRGDLGAALEQLRRPPRRRGLVVVISDFLGDSDWERPLRSLSSRHQLLATRRPGSSWRCRPRATSCGPAIATRPRTSAARSPRHFATPAPPTCNCEPTVTGSAMSCGSSSPVARARRRQGPARPAAAQP
jgi:hypothetical protein